MSGALAPERPFVQSLSRGLTVIRSLSGPQPLTLSEVARAITPVPGGVGPMTIAFLLVNTLRAARLQAQAQA